MAKFRKKPIVIEAVQLTDKSIHEVYTFIYGIPDLSRAIAFDKWGEYEQIVQRDGLKLKTLESENQTQTADIGDWIIKGIKDEFYPVKPDIFEATYEAVEE